jgi:ABC-type iron transport system FetAB ATPase subunit
VKVYKVKDVFPAGGMPSITYVDRDHLRLEAKIERAVDRGFAFNVVTGPTKSGKSVLCHQVLDTKKLVTMEGGQVTTAGEFWQQLAHRLQIAAGSTETNKQTDVLGGEVTAGWKLGALISVKSKAELSTGRDSARTYQTELNRLY